MTPDELERLVTAWIEHYRLTEAEAPRREEHNAKFRAEFLDYGMRGLVAADPPGRAKIEADFALRLQDHVAATWPSDATAWAREQVRSIMLQGDEAAWVLLLELVRRAPDELLTHVSAGPMEDFLTDETADAFEGRIELALRTDGRFRDVLSGAWNLPEKVQALADEYPPWRGTRG